MQSALSRHAWIRIGRSRRPAVPGPVREDRRPRRGPPRIHAMDVLHRRRAEFGFAPRIRVHRPARKNDSHLHGGRPRPARRHRRASLDVPRRHRAARIGRAADANAKTRIPGGAGGRRHSRFQQPADGHHGACLRIADDRRTAASASQCAGDNRQIGRARPGTDGRPAELFARLASVGAESLPESRGSRNLQAAQPHHPEKHRNRFRSGAESAGHPCGLHQTGAGSAQSLRQRQGRHARRRQTDDPNLVRACRRQCARSRGRSVWRFCDSYGQRYRTRNVA
ncbi:MAG: hypothetical protein BWZ10_03168 [candidate division BRC1 bacterium ADurb.BinA364]|nr:MAG: hypothetical protein BWZ10_03168 [candidate division BRC1 bacterium ADurb.BinA364]